MPDRVYSQYKNRPKAEAWYAITDEVAQPLRDALDAVRLSYDIDLNVGAQLDVIGRIVVVDRNTIGDITFDVAECNADGDYECGDDINAQCMPVSVIADQTLSDAYFRTLIRAKIVKNNSPATIDDVLDAVSQITPDVSWVRVIDPEDMSFFLETSSDPLTSIERYILLTEDIIPRPQGVRFGGFLEGQNLVECNADGDFECGDELAQCAGFIGGS